MVSSYMEVSRILFYEQLTTFYTCFFDRLPAIEEWLACDLDKEMMNLCLGDVPVSDGGPTPMRKR